LFPTLFPVLETMPFDVEAEGELAVKLF